MDANAAFLFLVICSIIALLRFDAMVADLERKARDGRERSDDDE